MLEGEEIVDEAAKEPSWKLVSKWLGDYCWSNIKECIDENRVNGVETKNEQVLCNRLIGKVMIMFTEVLF